MIFVDTGVWFAFYLSRDPKHGDAVSFFKSAAGPFVTTDYVVDELLTLFRARGSADQALVAGRDLLEGHACNLEWVTQDDFDAAWDTFQRFDDKE